MNNGVKSPYRINGLAFDADEIQGMISFVLDIAKHEYGIEVPEELQKETLLRVVSQYYEHVESYGVPVKGVDCYKFFAWMSYEFYKETCSNLEMARDLVISCISAMVATLDLERKTIPDAFIAKMIKMLFNEYANNRQHIGLGKNGLYISFRCASLVQIEVPIT